MFGIVIDNNGYKVEFGEINEKGLIHGYTLKKGESVITTEWSYANTLIRPQWNGSQWIERATQDEINNGSKIILTEQDEINAMLIKEIEDLKKEIATLRSGN
ncbi:MAG: hypothetical protein [Bacteriophage sp.]|nr:MAG: hypothetical protein [Bacteriophage sp.]